MSLLLALAMIAQDPAALVDNLGDLSPEVRERAEAALRSLGEAAEPALKAGANDRDAERALRCQVLLGHLELKRAGRIVFVEYRRDAGSYSLMSIDADGEHPVALQEGLTDAHHIIPSPDGSRATCWLEKERRVIVDVKKRVASPLRTELGYLLGWSPDARRLACLRFDEGRRKYVLSVHDPVADRTTELFSSDGVTEVWWTPDSRRLVFAAGGDWRLYCVDVASGAVETVDTKRFVSEVAISPDGQSAAALVSDYANSQSPDVVLISLKDRKVETLGTAGHGSDLAWAPDGTRILYRDRQGLVAVSVRDRAVVRLTAGEQRDFAAMWSRDGKLVHYCRDLSDRRDVDELHVVGADGAGDRVFGLAASPPQFSKDGRWLAYMSPTPGARCEQFQIMVASADDARAINASGHREACGTFFWSPSR